MDAYAQVSNAQRMLGAENWIPSGTEAAAIGLVDELVPGDHAALVARLKDYVARGLDPSQEIRKNRDFHNPMLLEKIVRYFDIDDIASQYPKHLFDPEAIANRRSKDKKKSSQSSPRAAEAAAPPPA